MNKNHPIIVYCYSKECEAAVKLIKKLNKLGYNNSVHYKAGIQRWKGPTENNENKNIIKKKSGGANYKVSDIFKSIQISFPKIKFPKKLYRNLLNDVRYILSREIKKMYPNQKNLNREMINYLNNYKGSVKENLKKEVYSNILHRAN